MSLRKYSKRYSEEIAFFEAEDELSIKYAAES